MVKTKYLIIAGGVLVAGIIAFFVFFQNEEAKIKKRFKFIAENIEKTSGENPIIAAAKANRTKKVITKSCKIHAPEYSFSGVISSDELGAFVFSKRAPYSEISLNLHDFIIDFPEKYSAQVNLTASMEGRLKTGKFVGELHELKCKLQKIDDIWYLKDIEVVEVLRK